jgi:DNA-binding Lrp family transcriptional regulator
MSNEQIISAVEKSAFAQNISRQSVMAELESIGVKTAFFESLTVDQLSALLFCLNKAMNSNPNSMNSQRIGKRAGVILSSIDKKILKALLESAGSPSSIQLSRDLDIPITTVQRRRKRLEEEFISESYTLNYEKFAMRHVTFLVSFNAGNTLEFKKEILALQKVIALTRTFGDGADLKIEAILGTNQEFIELSEKIKALPGVQKVSWFESIESLGKNNVADLLIIGSE